MTSQRLQLILIALLAVASLLTTLLLGLAIARQKTAPPVASHPAATIDLSDAADWQPLPRDRAQLPVLGQVPDFQLTDQRGQPFGSDELRGRVWIANFVFTRCTGPCPVMTQRTSLLQHELATWPRWADIRLVSFSVDPTHDTPAVLAAYARRFEADDQQWRFLTGSRDEIWKLSQQGFYLGVGDNPEDDPGHLDMPIFHSQKSALVDDLGQLRGHYNLLQQRERDQLLTDLQRLLDEQDQRRAPASATPDSTP
jgi:cytochrome oxidase Cu insertion factor (SCO1/SenC/PrrC family)